ncbi:alpha/beta hydrolase [Pseudonocardia acidicola]|uniref:alpha/beta hydrolase n=1 Tax=Pseudonocardia acidicola TaxID=2724939 RepID=UPI001EEFA6DB|nr:esterase [Pseudonocardia acidicola]
MLGFNASGFRLNTIWFVLGAVIVAAMLVVLVPMAWNRWRHRRLGRTTSVVFAVLATVLASGAAINRLGSFYPTLGTLVGTAVDNGTDPPPAGGGPARSGPGTRVRLSMHDTSTGRERPVEVYLPTGYDDPTLAGVRYPAVEWLGGGGLDATGLPGLLDDAITAQRMPPTVVVMPDMISGNDDTLTDDVRTWALGALRVRADRAGWALAGPGAAGLCPLDVALRHARTYAAAAGTATCGATAPPVAASGPPQPLALLAIAGADQSGRVAALSRIQAAAAPPVQLSTYVFPAEVPADGPRARLPAMLDWLGRQLPGPVVLPGQLPAGSTGGDRGAA